MQEIQESIIKLANTHYFSSKNILDLIKLLNEQIVLLKNEIVGIKVELDKKTNKRPKPAYLTPIKYETCLIED